MNKRFFVILVFVTIAVIGMALGARFGEKKEEGLLSAGAVVFPLLKSYLASIKRVLISPYDAANKAELVHTSTGWVVATRYNYPADFAKIRTLLEGASNAKFYEAKTADPENYALLGVADQKDKNSEGALLQIFVEGKTQPYELIVGKLAATWDGSYVRKPLDKQSWLLDRPIAIEANGADWLNQVVLAIDDKRVYQIEHETPHHKKLVVNKVDRAAKNYTAQNIPKDQLRYDTVADGMARNIASILLQDVQPATQFTFDEKAAYKATYSTYDGLVVVLTTEKRDDHYYLAVSASFDEALAKQYAQDAALADKAAPAQPPIVDGKADADAITKRTAGWAYEITQYTYTDLTKTMKDMLQEEAPEQKPTTDNPN